MSVLSCVVALSVLGQVPFEAALLELPDAGRLRDFHELIGREPHVAGTPGDERAIARLVEVFESMGLDVERHDFHAYLPLPVAARARIVGPVELELAVREDALDADPDTGHEDLGFGWNAYSASGRAAGEVVYANYATREDFEKLAEMGVEVRDRIVIARYGGNFRGYKARFAEEAGAAGLIIYTDPEDSGYGRGIGYPEGGWAHESHIQRGSIMTLPYAGDPLTPFEPATAGARRLDPEDVALPRIPVQPMSWRSASEILSRMTGPSVPSAWQGGLPFAYRVTGGADLRVELEVRQDRAVRRSANVLATLRGRTHPEQIVVVGCHHDAWGFGASDPLAGLMVVLECARSFAELARDGVRPRRTIVFAAWGAEEYGIIGSTEWVEARRDALAAGGVAYVNLDMAAMGPRFGASASPSLKPLVMDATRQVAQARAETGQRVFDEWSDRSAATGPSMGDLGGGSDHVGFLCHLGIPSCGLGAGGSDGSAYHSNHDTLAWYRLVVGDDYEPAVMLARVTNVMLARLAESPVLPLDPAQYAPDTREHLAALRRRAAELDADIAFDDLEAAIDAFEQVARPAMAAIGDLDPAAVELGRVNAALIEAERCWLIDGGLPGRPWFRNAYAATDPGSGYAPWMLPLLRHHVELADPAGAAAAEAAYVAIIERLTDICRRVQGAASGPSPP